MNIFLYRYYCNSTPRLGSVHLVKAQLKLANVVFDLVEV